MGLTATEAAAVVQRLAAKGLLVGDEWVPSGGAGTYAHHNPATGAVQADVALAGAADVDRAVAAARAALPVWQAVPATQRIAILHRLADLLDEHHAEACAINALDNGTPISIIDSGTYTASWVRYYAGWIDKLAGDVAPVYAADHLDLVLHEPYGVVAVIPPWNGPMMGMGQKAAPALAAGNTVVAKPPEIAPFGAVRFAELALDAGLPPGALNVVPGGAATGAALVAPSRDRQDLLHRRDRHRPPGDGRRIRVAHAARLRAGRQVGQPRVPRRRPRPRVRHRRSGRLGHAQRPGLRAPHAPLRARRRVRRRRRTGRGARRERGRRRSARSDGDDGPGRHRAGVRAHPRRHRSRARRRGGHPPHRREPPRRRARRPATTSRPRCSATSTRRATSPATRSSGPCSRSSASATRTRSSRSRTTSPYGLAAYVYTRDIARAHRLARARSTSAASR